MSMWTKKTKSAPGVTVGGKTPPIPVGGRDAPGHGFDPKKIVAEHTAMIRHATWPMNPVTKANDNHDERGRFSAAGGGSPARSKMTIEQAANALHARGMKMESLGVDLASKQTRYAVTDAHGTRTETN